MSDSQGNSQVDLRGLQIRDRQVQVQRSYRHMEMHSQPEMHRKSQPEQRWNFAVEKQAQSSAAIVEELKLMFSC